MSSEITKTEDIISDTQLYQKNDKCKITSDEECNNNACGNCAVAIGCSTKAFGDCSFSEGSQTKAYGNSSHSEGYATTANGDNSHSEGYSTVALGNASHAEGSYTTAQNYYSHAEGSNAQAKGYASHAEGYYSSTELDYSHAEGYRTDANGYYSHTEGYYSKTNGTAAHAEGYNTLASGTSSHAEGYYTVANAPYSHAEGYYTNTRNAVGSNIMGIYGDADSPYSWFLGGGTSDTQRALAAKILYTGDAYIKNAWNSGGTGYAELFQSGCQTIEAGYFVTLRDDRIQLINSFDDYVLGVTSASPGFVANSMELKGNTAALNVSKSNSNLTTDNVIPEVKDQEGNIKIAKLVDKVPVPVTDLDHTKNQIQYSESGSYWTTVVLLGQVVVFDDGTCKPNHYCLPNENGVATISDNGYRVMKRLYEDKILIMLK